LGLFWNRSLLSSLYYRDGFDRAYFLQVVIKHISLLGLPEIIALHVPAINYVTKL